LNRPSAAAMRSYVKLLFPFVITIITRKGEFLTVRSSVVPTF